jgi:hypothetical protein
MNTCEVIWRKLGQGKGYRANFALAFLKRSIPFQIKVLRKKHCGSQAILAERANLTQGVVSRAEDQDYGNLTFNTVGRIAAGLDMAFIGRFVPFSELVKFSQELSETEFSTIPTFDEENASLSTDQESASVVCLTPFLTAELGSVEESATPPKMQPKSVHGPMYETECGTEPQAMLASGD